MSPIESLSSKYFKLTLARVASEKRDSIPDETLNFWWDTIDQLKWTKEKFDAQILKLKSAKIYGVIKIDDIINPICEENIYTQADLQREIKLALRSLATKGEALLKGKNISLDLEAIQLDKDAIIAAVMKRLKYYNTVEVENIGQELVDEIFEKIVTEKGLKQSFERVGAGTRLRKQFNF